MSYNSGNFSLLNQNSNTSSSQIFANSIIPTFSPPSGSTYINVYGSNIAPSVISKGTSTVGAFYGAAISLAIASSQTVSNAFSLAVGAPTITSGTLLNLYALFVSSPTTTGTGAITNNYTASIGGFTGIGTTTPKNMLDVAGGFVVGTYAGGIVAGSNNVLVSGSVGIGTASPSYSLDVWGAASALQVTAPGTGVDNQTAALSQGYNQGGFGGGSVGTNKTMSANTTQVFDTAAFVNSNSVAFFGGIFDGRYVYFAPFNNKTTVSGQITRYDTFSLFSASSSYAVYDTKANVNSNSFGFMGAGFDGRYVYFVPNALSTTPSGQITRYDTTVLFTSASSYAVFDTAANVNPNSKGFASLAFDGRYFYFVPYAVSLTTFSGQITRYDTTLPFTQAASYAVFDTTTVQSNSAGFAEALFDGRYIYFIPNNNSTSYFGQITRYDTTLSFSSSNSYAVFNTQTLSTASAGFVGGTFDGRYVYLSPGTTFSGQITRYDTTGSFTSTVSYAFFNTTVLQSNSSGFRSAIFDGRYIYYVPFNNNSYFGQITRYDTTLSFSASSSYSFFNTASVNSNSVGFRGAMFDGRYIYLAPGNNGTTLSGQITRIDSYPGLQANAINVSQAPNGFVVGSYAGNLTALNQGLIVSGQVGIGTGTPAYTLDVQGVVSAQSVLSAGTTQNNQEVQLFEGYNQGGFGGGSVGTSKTMSANTTQVFDTAAFVNSNSVAFFGGVFDGRYLYFAPFNNKTTVSGQITRFDTMSSFSASNSYAVYDTKANVNSNSFGFMGALFDGRYAYMIPNSLSTTPSGQITQYDTTQPFTLASSYVIFDTTTIQSNSKGFGGGVFDGRYIYLAPFAISATTYSGQVTRYDTTLPFAVSSSYSVFNTATIQSTSVGFGSAIFDGRYVYFVPYLNSTSFEGLLTRYDTSLSFNASTSYAVFDTQTVSTNSKGFNTGVFDGRYAYLIPATSFSGQITRYDTTGSFTSTASYAVFDTTTVQSNSQGFEGEVFDGRYLYLIPFNNGTYFGQITKYDTTLSFTLASSYSTFNTATVQSNSVGFRGALFDGRYIYLVPGVNGLTLSGQITRLDAYSGPQANAMNVSQSPNGIALGSYAGAVTAPSFGLIMSGQMGVGTASPNYTLEIAGALSVQNAPSPGTTGVNQNVQLFEGYNQGGYGGGSIGTNKTMSANTTLTFDTAANVNSNSTAFFGGVFDGRYLYFAPFNNKTTVSGQITRFDTMSSFSSSNSYAVYDTKANVNSKSFGFMGALFDGRYVYMIPNSLTTVVSGQITQYDTTQPFTSAASYAVFDTTTAFALSKGFAAGVFDGRYIYLAPFETALGVFSGRVTRYDTTLPFGTASSYALFDTAANVDANSLGFGGAIFDGRYVYFVPYLNSNSYFGQITRYDTSLSFTSATSYSVFDTQTVSTNSKGFNTGIFDGRYAYLLPATSFSGQITRYDTTGSFTSTASYDVFDTTIVQSNSMGFKGGAFDGRYLYLSPFNNGTYFGQITKYDTTLSFTLASSYSIFDTATVQSNSAGFRGALFDGRYIYLVPGVNTRTLSGQITRIDAYSGPQANAIAASQAPNGFAIGTYAGSLAQGNLIVSGSVGIGTSSPAYPIDIAGNAAAQQINANRTTINNQRVVLSQGYNQGGFGGGSVGTNKTMSANTTQFFDIGTNVNSLLTGLGGTAFDGRYVYLNPRSNTIWARYDTTASFGTSASYSLFDTNLISGSSTGFSRLGFDGTFIYMAPLQGQSIICRYNVTLPFGATTSYASFDIATQVNSLAGSYEGIVYDGRYIYFVPFRYAVRNNSGLLGRYDSLASFTSPSSYTLFNLSTNVNSISQCFVGGTFDGRYVYLSTLLFPGTPASNGSGQITRYDTTASFTSSSSYVYFYVEGQINSICQGFGCNVFDGKYVYFVGRQTGNGTKTGVIMRYDTTSSFTAVSSYLSIDSTSLQSNSTGFSGAIFDGRYVYYTPGDIGASTPFGQITQYDTTLPFSASTSYSFFNLASINSNAVGYFGPIFDGQYLYLPPSAFSLFARVTVSPGPQVSALAISQSPGTFTVNNQLTFTVKTSGSATASSSGSNPSTSAGYLTVFINGSPQKIPYFN